VSPSWTRGDIKDLHVSRADAARGDVKDLHVRGRSRLGRTFRTASRRGSSSGKRDGATAGGASCSRSDVKDVTYTECYLYTCVYVYV
jgi:hypothetical protein